LQTTDIEILDGCVIYTGKTESVVNGTDVINWRDTTEVV
jgi:hypothetical protein